MPFEKKNIDKKILIIWNDDAFSQKIVGNNKDDNEKIKRYFPSSSIIKSLKELDIKRGLGAYNAIIILAELAWEGKKYSDFFGFDVAFKLIQEGCQLPIVFCSFVNRIDLRKKTEKSTLLNPVFQHLQLPLNTGEINKLDLNTFSDVKWSYIKNCFLLSNSIAGKIKHAFALINENSSYDFIQEQISQVLLFEKLLDAQTLKYLKDLQKVVKSGRSEKLMQLLNEFKNHLNQLSRNDKAKVYDENDVNISQEKILLVEDNADIRNTLTEGFSQYFEVNAIANGDTAIDHLNKNPFEYIAVISDLELLDDKNNWQPIQGYDVLEYAQRFPHLSLYALTGLSRQAVSTINDKLKVTFLYKQENDYTPTGWTFARLAAAIMTAAKERSKNRKGPQKGFWPKGLLSYFYSREKLPDWKDFISNITDSVDNLITSGKNDKNFINRTLLNVKTTKFNDKILHTILQHRLFTLYIQTKDEKVSYKKLVELIGFQCSSPKQYFSSLLGLPYYSVRAGFDLYDQKVEKNDDEIDNFQIVRENLLDHEKEWLKRKFPEKQKIQFVNLFDTIELANCKLPADQRKNLSENWNLSECKEWLKSILNALLGINNLNSLKSIKKIFDEYFSEYHNEAKNLSKNPAGKEIIRLMQKFLKSNQA